MAITIRDTELRFNGNYTVRNGNPKGVMLHHAAASGSVDEIHAYHKNINGWAGIGYHFYVRKNGNIFRGRPENWLGAHATGYNDHIGVCAEGNFENETMPAAQQAAIVEVLRYLFEKYGTLTVQGHRDAASTACPGKNYPFAAIVQAAKNPVGNAKPSAVNAKVLAFQKAMIADGVALPRYGADGIWGEETAKATENYLQKGSTGERVKTMQSLLKKAGYDLGKAGVDGIFGSKTDEALRAFQTAQDIGVDGVFGPETAKPLLGV